MHGDNDAHLAQTQPFFSEAFARLDTGLIKRIKVEMCAEQGCAAHPRLHEGTKSLSVGLQK